MDATLRLGKFTCNLCGAANDSSSEITDREQPTCDSCGSSIRVRSVILALARAVFGLDLALPDFPRLKSVRGLGISDSDSYAGRLEERFSYTNTFYDREPLFDLMHPDEREKGKYDFVICSEVLEHVPTPVDPAFQSLSSVLRPDGVAVLTTPYSLGADTVEQFHPLREFGIAEIGGHTVLVNRGGDGAYEVYDQLSFHAGRGATVEMRIYSESDLRARLAAAGLPHIQIHGKPSRQFGVVFSQPWSLPITAGRAPFSLSRSGITELTEQLARSRRVLDLARQSKWVRLGRRLGVGPEIA
jgi:SAM-dependent methyltransferase